MDENKTASAAIPSRHGDKIAVFLCADVDHVVRHPEQTRLNLIYDGMQAMSGEPDQLLVFHAVLAIQLADLSLSPG